MANSWTEKFADQFKNAFSSEGFLGAFLSGNGQYMLVKKMGINNDVLYKKSSDGWEEYWKNTQNRRVNSISDDGKYMISSGYGGASSVAFGTIYVQQNGEYVEQKVKYAESYFLEKKLRTINDQAKVLFAADGKSFVEIGSNGDCAFFRLNGSSWEQSSEVIDFVDDYPLSNQSSGDPQRYINFNKDLSEAVVIYKNTSNSLSAQQFKYSNGNFVKTSGEQIFSSIESSNLSIGYLQISGDLSTVALTNGKRHEKDHSVKVFRQSGSTWSHELTIDSLKSNDYLGLSPSPTDQTIGSALGLSHNGKILVVGAGLADGSSLDSGYASIYMRNNTDDWKKVSNDINGEFLNHQFGGVVGISADGLTLFAGTTPVYAGIRKGNEILKTFQIEPGQLSYIDLGNIKDYDGNLQAGASPAVSSNYLYQGSVDVNDDGESEMVFTNDQSGRWATVGEDFDFSDHGIGGSTRVVGLYDDPLVLSGEVEAGSPHDSQVRFQNDLYDDNLRLGSAADVDNDGFGEVFWKTTDGSAFLRSIHHLDGNVKYANYMNAGQMTDYLSQHGHMGDIGSSLGL